MSQLRQPLFFIVQKSLTYHPHLDDPQSGHVRQPS